MKYLQDIEDITNLKAIVLQDLKGIGVKAPKPKKCKNKDEQQVGGITGSCPATVFGNYLSCVPSLLVDGYGPVPRFLVEATAVLDEHIQTEGLFRKSGSVARQKELREKIETGSMLTDANPLDLASLIKQFFRELADPLLTFKLHDTFLKAYMNLEEEHSRRHATLLLCLLLPWPHLSTLRFFMIFLGRVASQCDINKMDVANLAVCLAPNILHNNQKMEKMSGSESKLLKIQTNIVEFLISNANSIGMVSDSLADRTVMLSTYFPSDDELEKSDDGLNDSKPKKKKKRSGSLQGLVNNLSNSFSKWRRDSKGHNNSNMSNQSNMSDKSSMYSMMSDPTDFSVMSQDVTGFKDGSFDAQGIMLSEVTPKVMRKRKMSGEMIPFSANKKKAILQQMPHMSTLGGTPFTPLSRTRSQGHDFRLDTPNIKFTEDSSRLLFSASTHTPMNNSEHLLLPSTAKIKRHNSSRSSCFNQKTPKSKRRSVRGFLRKLSGGRELQPANAANTAARLADISGPPDHVTIIKPGSGKKKGFFSSRKHRKTPSLPARLVMKEGRAVAVHDDLDNSCDTTANGSKSESGFEIDSSPMLRTRRRGFSADGTPTSAAIRRGRPNTVSVGLPAEKMSGGNRSRRSIDIPPRHSSQRDIFASPERKVPLDCDAAAIDTSPIKADPFDEGDIPRVSFDDFEEDESMLEKCIDQDNEEQLDQSTTSTCMETVPHDQAMHEHDQAFIHEMTVCTEQMEKVSEPPDGFKKPLMVPVKRAEKEIDSSLDSDKMDASVSSDASNTSVITVLYNGQPLPSKPPLASASLPRPKSCHLPMTQKTENAKQLRTQLSAGSIDSGLGHESQEYLNSLSGKLPKSVSKNSLLSNDSALGRDETEQKKAAFMSQFEDRKITHEKSDSALLQKKKSQTVRRRSHEPNLQMSADVQHMLSRAGVIPQESEKTQTLPKHSVVNLRENNVGKVAESVKQFDYTQVQEVAARKAEPLRFHKSVARRGTSPLRIPTIFVKADQEVMKYKEMVSRGRSPAPKSSAKPALPISTNLLRTSSVKSAKLKLASNDSEQEGKPQQQTPESSSSATSVLSPVDMSESLIETINDVCTPKSEKISKHPFKDSSNIDDMVVMTPRIKPCMLSTSLTAKILTKGLNTPRGSLEGKTISMRKCRSPVKTVKRLQGSPSSPRSPHKSPTKVTNKHSISPLPSHVSDWNF